jgi:pimeloyl-ACP methyl ester carboxylesterase
MTDTTVGDIDVNGLTLRVHQAGDPAKPIVMLCHGFPELGHSWRHPMAPLAEAGYHVLAPDRSWALVRTNDISAYGIGNLTDDLLALLDHFGKNDAVFVGHDWGALIVWELARLHPQRVRGVVGVSVPYVSWPGRPTDLMKMMYGDRFFYILYFQQAAAEREFVPTPGSMAKFVGCGGVGSVVPTGRPVPPMERQT